MRIDGLGQGCRGESTKHLSTCCIIRGLILGGCSGIRVYEMNHTVGLVDLGVAQTDLDSDKYCIPIYLKQPSSWLPPLTSADLSESLSEHLKIRTAYSMILLLERGSYTCRSQNLRRSTQGSSPVTSSRRGELKTAKMVNSFHGDGSDDQSEKMAGFYFLHYLHAWRVL